MARWWRLLLLCASVNACGGEAPTPASHETPTTAPAPTLPIGRTLVYALQWTVDSGVEPDGGSPIGLPLAGGLRIEGELHLQAVESRADGTIVAAWFDALGVRELTVNGERIEVEPAALVGPKAWFLLDGEGAVARVWFDADGGSLFRHVMAGALAHFDLRGALAGASPVVVPTGHGLSEARYAREGAGTVRRELAALVRFDAVAGVDADRAAVEGVAELALDEAGVPSRFGSDEAAKVRERDWAFSSHDRFDATRVRVEDGEPLAPPGDLSRLADHDPAAPRDTSEAERALAQRFAGEMEVQDVANAVTALDGGLLPSGGFASRATGLLRGWPERARELGPVALGATGHGRQLVFDLLASAGTPEAQAVMRELLEREEVQAWPEHPLLVGRFAFVRAPTVETALFVLELHTRARAAHDDELARAILYPLGSVARAIDRSDPWLGALLHARLIEVFAHAVDARTRIAATAGLGNCGRLEDRAHLLPLLRDDDDAVRMHAATALRDMIAPDATAALVAALRDPDRAVAATALDVLSDHHWGTAGSAVLAAIVIAGEHNPELDHELVNALADRMAGDPGVPAALRTLAARTSDRDLAARIARLLES
jgi:hypothetical protein